MNIYLISSSGGHLTELLFASEGLDAQGKKILLTSQDFKIPSVDFRYIVNPHRSFLSYMKCLAQTMKYFLQLPPHFIISTGAGIALPGLVLGKFFGARVVFIESLAYIDRPTMTGRIAYWLADLFLVQHSALLTAYPAAKLVRLL